MIIFVLRHLRKVTLFTVILYKRQTFSTVKFSLSLQMTHDFGPSQYTSMEDISLSCEGVVKLLMTLRLHKAAGPDDIPLMLLTEAADEISPAITLLFQLSLNQGNTPSTWRKALVPILRKGSKSDASNYRPISLTTVLCKLCEHILHSTILTHLASHKILSDAQHGFRKKKIM